MPKTKQLVVALGALALLALTALTQISPPVPLGNTAAVVLFDDSVPPIVVADDTINTEISVRERLLAQLRSGAGDVIELPQGVFPVVDTTETLNTEDVVPEIETTDSCLTGQDSAGSCVSAAERGAIESTWLGFAADGKIVFSQSEGGQLVSPDSLDSCGGHEHPTLWEGQVVTLYHYHALDGQLSSVGCLAPPPVVAMPLPILVETEAITTE